LGFVFTVGVSFVLLTTSQISAAGVLSVHFFDAGGNSGYDAVLVQTPDGSNVVIDSGRNLQGNDFARFLVEHGVGRIHYLIASNAAADYVGMHDSLIWQYNRSVERILDVGQPASNSDYVDYIETACAHNVEINTPRDGDVISIGSVELSFLSPSQEQLAWISDGNICDEGYLAGAESDSTYSLVFQLQYEETSILFTGDLGDQELFELLDRHSGELVSTVLKLPRHGGNVGYYRMALIEETSPEMAVAMASSLDHFGRPCDSLLDELSTFEIPTYVTGIHGTVSLFSDGRTLIIETERDVTNNALELQDRNSAAESC